MDFRFALIPAGAAASGAAAGELAGRMRRAGECEPSAAISQVLGALDGSPVGHYVGGLRHTILGTLMAADYPESGLLEALLILAKDHDLAVYDIEIDRLYDPAGSIDVGVLLPHVRMPFLTRELLADLVSHPEWPDPEAPYLIVERADQDFIQAWLGADGVYQFEYREGGPESHFRFRTDDGELVVRTMWAWATQDETWRTAVDWQFVDLDEEEGRRGHRSVSLQNEYRDDGSHLTMHATLTAGGDLEVAGQDSGSVATVFGDDYEWWYTIAADDIPALVTALGVEQGSGILDVLERNYSGPGAHNLYTDLRSSGVPYTFNSWP